MNEAETVIDFADREQSGRFPKHGWARNSQDVKLLWLPIISLVRDPEAIRRDKGVAHPLNPGVAHNSLPFCETVLKLAVTLRELHSFNRSIAGIDLAWPNTEEHATLLRARDMIPLYVDLAYVYLRRLADSLTIAIGLVLFEHYESAPTGFKNLRTFIADQQRVNKAKPLADPRLVQEAIQAHSAWFDRLTKKPTHGGKKGIRDAMEHRAVRFTGGFERVDDQPVRRSVFLYSQASDVDREEELMSTLRTIVAELCELWTSLCRSVGWKDTYGRGDWVWLSGNGDDITGSWPEI